MYLPSNPKIAIIDDKIDEVSPLFAVFSKAGIPFVYFDGSEDSFPVDGFSSIRLIVLDIDIKGGAFDEKTAASICASAVDKIIKNENQLYCIGFWTRHSKITRQIIQNLSIIKKEPIGTFDWGKSELLSKSNGDLIIALSEKIKDGIKDKAFEFLVFWENKIAQETSKFTHFFECIPQMEGITRNEQILNILSKLACSYTGKAKLKESEPNTIFATKKLNSGFIDFLRYDEFDYSLDLPTNSSLSLNEIAIINNLLFVDEKNKSCKIENGSVIEIEEEMLYNALLNDLRSFNVSDCFSKLVGVVLSPPCDLAHDKVLKPSPESGGYYYRVLYGLLFDLDNDSSIEKLSPLISIDEKRQLFIESVKRVKEYCTKSESLDMKKAEIEDCISKMNTQFLRIPDRIFVTEPFVFDGKSRIIVFNYSSFSTRLIPKENMVLFQFRAMFVHDLQTKIAIHVNRLGNDMVGL